MKRYLYIYLALSISLIAQISPGDLTEAHKDLEGMSNCTKCHELGEEVKDEKCLDCHSEIKLSIEQNSGFHSSPEVTSQKCYQCHSEHHGRNFQIIRFDKDNFEHSTTGFDLAGKHAEIKCEDCHKREFIQSAELKDNEGTFLGLSQSCNSCHDDYHQGTLGTACADCHDTKSFKPASKFDHNSAKFKLAGAHNDVECKDCHKIEIRNNKSFQVFVGLQFERCINCHTDVHKGKFGPVCEDCHSTVSFKQIKNIEKFDHSQTNFALIGQHQFVKCKDCHKTSLTAELKHEKCIDCHKDYHKGEFTANGEIRDCSECHLESGYLPSTYTLELHQKTGFALTGSHLALPCVFCHKTNDEYHFKFSRVGCIECHDNIHKGFISSKFLSDDNCIECHKTTMWSEVEFDHNRTNFKLEGKHGQIVCSSCHIKKNGNALSQNFVNLSTLCESCHKDVHFNQFKIDGKTNCERCHGFNNWQAEKFDHAKTKFPLDGKHANVSCEKCHKQIETPVGKFVKYKIEETKCIDCHSS